MPGGLLPFPRRFGASDRRLQATLESILASLGAAYTTDPSSLVWVKAMAAARAIYAAQEQNRKLAAQFDPGRATAFLSRWEHIFGISPAPGATDVARRAELSRRWARIGRFPKLSNLIKTLQEVLPNTFVGVVTQGASDTGTISHTYTTLDLSAEFGVTITGDGQWGSSVHYVAIQTTCPASMLIGSVPGPDFYREVGGVYPVLDRMLPVWVTFDWFRDGASGAGFFLDDDPNLDVEQVMP